MHSNSKEQVKRPVRPSMDAQISIVRPPGTSDDTEIRLIIRIAMGKTITAVMTPEDFALAVIYPTRFECQQVINAIHVHRPNAVLICSEVYRGDED
ncbi:hypothetical protein ACH19I_14285 [Yersinia kristensenii]|uniref:hypothetical protein n=1 Tax=Yersinia kristensenii TaxID=28152 RepID=UPI003896B6F1